MAKILVVTHAHDGDGEMVFSERLNATHLDSQHSGENLLERVRWALRDAERIERRARLRTASRRRGSASRNSAA